MTSRGGAPFRPSSGGRIFVSTVSTLLVAALLAYIIPALQGGSAGITKFSAPGAKLVRTVGGQLWSTRFQTLPAPDAYNTNGSGNPSQTLIRWQRGLLGVGIDNAASSQFFGYFLETKQAFPAGAFVQTQMEPYPAANGVGQAAQTIIAVQTASTDRTGLLNYVIVSYRQDAGNQSLLVGFANGLVRGATTTTLDTVVRPGLLTAVQNQPVTVTTNGTNSYEAWLGSTPVYRGTNLHLRIPPPFQVYLEVQAAATDYTAYFRTLYVYRSDHVTITGLPPGADVRLSVSAPMADQLDAIAAGSGTASMLLPPPNLTVDGTLRISARGRSWVFSGITLHGGDIYQWRSTL